jgi:hypothetical protein
MGRPHKERKQKPTPPPVVPAPGGQPVASSTPIVPLSFLTNPVKGF